LVAVIKPKSQSVFAVNGVDTFGCEGRDSITIKVIACTEIAEENSDRDFKIFPNPSDGIYYIDTEAGEKVEVIDTRGRIVYQATCPGKMHQVDICKLPAGIYLMVLRGKGEYRTATLIKN
jgi:hypothetical protein